MIVYPPIFYGAELKLAFKGRLTWKVADTLQSVVSFVGFSGSQIVEFTNQIKRPAVGMIIFQIIFKR